MSAQVDLKTVITMSKYVPGYMREWLNKRRSTYRWGGGYGRGGTLKRV